MKFICYSACALFWACVLFGLSIPIIKMVHCDWKKKDADFRKTFGIAFPETDDERQNARTVVDEKLYELTSSYSAHAEKVKTFIASAELQMQSSAATNSSADCERKLMCRVRNLAAERIRGENRFASKLSEACDIAEEAGFTDIAKAYRNRPVQVIKAAPK